MKYVLALVVFCCCIMACCLVVFWGLYIASERGTKSEVNRYFDQGYEAILKMPSGDIYVKSNNPGSEIKVIVAYTGNFTSTNSMPKAYTKEYANEVIPSTKSWDSNGYFKLRFATGYNPDCTGVYVDGEYKNPLVLDSVFLPSPSDYYMCANFDFERYTP